MWYAYAAAKASVFVQNQVLLLTAMKTVYQFVDEDKRRFVVHKFYRPQRWTADQIRENMNLH